MRTAGKRHALAALLVPIVMAACAAHARAQALFFRNDLPGTFLDIGATGEDLQLTGEDEVTRTTTIGNTVFPAGQIVIGNNGGVGFAPPNTDLAALNQAIPSLQAFGGGQSLLPYWDDIGDGRVGHVYYQEFPGDRFVVEWQGRPIVGTNATVDFELQVFGGVGPGPVYAQFLYRDIDQLGAQGTSATIGYQDDGRGFNDVQWSFNTTGAVANGTVLSLTSPEPSSLAAFGLACLLLSRGRALRRRLR